MNLDDYPQFAAIDPEKMIDQITGLPEQLLEAWESGLKFPLPHFQPVNRVVIAGMGGSAIGADLLSSLLMDRVTIPVIIQRDYDLPAFAFGKETLVIISTHSGNTEESLSAFEAARRCNCQTIVITTGGKILADAQSAGIPVWVFTHNGQPRAAVGFSFGLLLALFVRLGLVHDLSEEVAGTVDLMKKIRNAVSIDVPIHKNPAKRLAGQMTGRHITVFGSGFMAPVARRWKSQINEVAKAIASFEILPEADHNTLAGICFPEDALAKEMSIFLQASMDHVRNQKRVIETRQIMLVEGLNTDMIEARGNSRMEQMWSTLLFGDYVSFYLAMIYEVNPTEIAPILALKDVMRQ